MRLDVDGMGPSTRIGTGGRALSGGEQRRLALARAAAARPAVLLLDEPVEGLDPGTAREVLGNLRLLLPDTTLVVAVHDRHLPDLPPGFGAALSLDDGIDWHETSA
jgi:ATP-binding cassette subfamily C protein CydC